MKGIVPCWNGAYWTISKRHAPNRQPARHQVKRVRLPKKVFNKIKERLRRDKPLPK